MDIKQHFAWDEAKAASNLRKHRVSFGTATRAFLDPFAFVEQDRIENGELRWQTTGLVDDNLLLVAHTVLELDDDGEYVEVIEIISARRVDRKERNRYEQNKLRSLHA